MGTSCSFSNGKLAPWHDFRLSTKDNINPELSGDNIALVNNLAKENGDIMSLEEYTDKRFQGVIDEYNAKQKKPCRRIKEGYSKHFKGDKSNDGKPLAYEYVVQFGDSEGLGGEYYNPQTSPERKEEIRQEYATVYNQFIADLQKRFPHLEVVYATIHFDEPDGTPHMHMAVQPVAEGYQRGLSQQVSMSKALALDGLTSSKEHGWSFAQFCGIVHNEILRPMLESRGYELSEQKHGEKHLTPEQYKALKAKEAELEASIAVKEKQEAQLKTSVQRAEKTLKGLQVEVATAAGQVQSLEEQVQSLDRQKTAKEAELKALAKAPPVVIEAQKMKLKDGSVVAVVRDPKQVDEANQQLNEYAEENDILRYTVRQLEGRLKGFADFIKSLCRNVFHSTPERNDLELRSRREYLEVQNEDRVAHGLQPFPLPEEVAPYTLENQKANNHNKHQDFTR